MPESERGASPSSRRDELYYYGIIEGALHSRGEEAFPVKVWHAIRMLGQLLGAPVIVPDNIVIPAKTERAITSLKEMAEELADPHPETSRCKWLPWQVNLLREMKANNESVPAIASAVEKTTAQVNNKWFQLRKEVSPNALADNSEAA